MCERRRFACQCVLDIYIPPPRPPHGMFGTNAKEHAPKNVHCIQRYLVISFDISHLSHDGFDRRQRRIMMSGLRKTPRDLLKSPARARPGGVLRVAERSEQRSSLLGEVLKRSSHTWSGERECVAHSRRREGASVRSCKDDQREPVAAHISHSKGNLQIS